MEIDRKEKLSLTVYRLLTNRDNTLEDFLTADMGSQCYGNIQASHECHLNKQLHRDKGKGLCKIKN